MKANYMQVVPGSFRPYRFTQDDVDRLHFRAREIQDTIDLLPDECPPWEWERERDWCLSLAERIASTHLLPVIK